MNNCDAVQLHLAEFLDGDLTTDTAQLVTAHLARCSACTAELDREQSLRALLGGLEPAPCPPELTRRLRSVPLVAGPAAAGSRRLQRWLPVGLTAVLAASLVAVVLLQTPRDLPPAGPGAAEFSPAQIAEARADLAWTLALTARVIDYTDKKTVRDVFGRTLPAAITGSLRSATVTPQGG